MVIAWCTSGRVKVLWCEQILNWVTSTETHARNWGYKPFHVELDASVKMHSFANAMTVESTLIQNKTVTYKKTFFQHEMFKYHQISFVLVTVDQPLFWSHDAFLAKKERTKNCK